LDGPRLRDMIEEEIAEGRLRPGERLEEVDLARRYGVSRTPIREALKQLAAIGLVASQPRRTVVASLSPAELVEMFDVMAELEGMAGRLAARRWNADDAARLARPRRLRRGGADARTPMPTMPRTSTSTPRSTGRATTASSPASAVLPPAPPLSPPPAPASATRIATFTREHGASSRRCSPAMPRRLQALLRDHVVVQGDRFADLIASLPDLQRTATG
jgi:hypothetical protein